MVRFNTDNFDKDSKNLLEQHVKDYHNNCKVFEYKLNLHDKAINDLKAGTEELVLNVSKLTDKVADLTAKEELKYETKNKLYVGIVLAIFTALITILIGVGGWLLKNSLNYVAEMQNLNNKAMQYEIYKLNEKYHEIMQEKEVKKEKDKEK